MIFFKPHFDRKKAEKTVFEAIENGESCGKCTMVFESNKAVITSLEYDKDRPYLVEGLIKAAFNFAANNNYYMGYCKCSDIASFLEKMNLEKADGVYFGDIPSILMGNCCKCPDNI